MLRILSISAFILCAFASQAWAGDNEWTPSQIKAGGSSSITMDSATTSPILETRLCGAGIIWTDDTDVTYDIQICRGSDATTCVTRNSTSPLDSATNFGAEFPVAGAYIRLDLDAIVGDPTFTFDCLP